MKSNEKTAEIFAAIPHLAPWASDKFTVLAGPCVVESLEITLNTASALKDICHELELPFIFKASFRKANRSRLDSFTGLGDEKALEILASVKERLKVPIVTDIHSPEDAEMAAKVVDVLQIPAFLCRQTDLLVAAAQTGKVVNIKKGQFLAPEAMAFAAEKVKAQGNGNILLTERGTMFGYQDLVVDYRGIPAMRAIGYPVIVDVTHSLQQPNQSSGVTGGKPQLIGLLARLAVIAGAEGLFFETHPNPAEAKSDGANMLPLSEVKPLLQKLAKLKKQMADIYPEL